MAQKKSNSLDYKGVEIECSNVKALNARNQDFYTVSTITTAGAVTLTAAQILGGMILQDCSGAGRTDTLPTAALLKAAMGNEIVAGSGFEFTIKNTSDAAETITVAAGTGGTASGTMTIAQNNSKRFLLVITNASTPTYTVYSLGTVVH